MFPRIREIEDALGSRLRLGVEAHASGSVVTIACCGQTSDRQVLLDLYGSEVLRAYIEAARLALPQDLPEEHVDGAYPVRLRLRREPCIALLVTQAGHDQPLSIPATFWDRLHAELGVANAHARELDRRAKG